MELSYLIFLLKDAGGLLLFNCNYDIKDYSIYSLFYSELLKWWSEFCKTFGEEGNWHYIIWNNRDIRINKKPVYYKKYFESGVIRACDLFPDLNNIDSFM